MKKIILGTSTQRIILEIVGFQNRLLALLSQPCFYEEKSQRNFKRLWKLIGFFTHFSTWIFFRAIRKMKFLKVNSKFFYTHYIQQQLSIGTGSMAPNKRQMTHRGLKLQKRFTNLSSESSRCPGEKGRSCIKWKKNTRDPIKILYFLHVLPFSPWDSQFKPMSENTGHSM